MRKYLLIGILTGCTFSLKAQEQPKLLTFDDAVKIALQNGVLFNQQKNNLAYNQIQKVQSIVAIGPTVSATATGSQINGNSFNPNTGSVINGIRDNVTGTLNANINLFSGFNRINTIKQYYNQLDAQAYYVNRTSQDLINTVATQYLQVMLDVELMKIARENFDALDKQLKQVKEQVTLGARSPVDEYNQDALTKAAELKFVQAEIALNNDKTLLTQTLLIDPFEQYEVSKPGWDINTIDYDLTKIEDLADKAKQYRGDYLRAVKNEAAYKFSTAAAKGFMMPSLYAFGTYGSAYNFQHGVPDSVSAQQTKNIIVTDPTAPSGYSIQNQTTYTTISNPEKPRPFSEQFRANNVFKQYGLQLSIPIFSGLQNRANYVQQKVLYENAILTRKNLEYQIKNDVIRAVRNYEGARKSYSVSINQYTAAEMALQLETERYSLGVTNFVDFANANRVFVQAQTDKAQAEYRLLFQKVLVDYAVGTLKPEDFK
ncbi:MAG: TolC family protein [Bacteroidetes bacterium]|nr:TolC family protein [Bacteroidota bacterium]